MSLVGVTVVYFILFYFACVCFGVAICIDVGVGVGGGYVVVTVSECTVVMFDVVVVAGVIPCLYVVVVGGCIGGVAVLLWCMLVLLLWKLCWCLYCYCVGVYAGNCHTAVILLLLLLSLLRLLLLFVVMGCSIVDYMG